MCCSSETRKKSTSSHVLGSSYSENKNDQKCLCVFLQSILWVRLIFSLAPLVSKVKEPQVETMVDTLCSNMMSDKEQLRDISSMGLKTVIAELPLTSSGEN